jgi:hypothetical protein
VSKRLDFDYRRDADLRLIRMLKEENMELSRSVRRYRRTAYYLSAVIAGLLLSALLEGCQAQDLVVGEGEGVKTATMTSEASEEQCPNGGEVVVTFMDANNNGIPDPGETITSATVRCDEEPEVETVSEPLPTFPLASRMGIIE